MEGDEQRWWPGVTVRWETFQHTRCSFFVSSIEGVRSNNKRKRSSGKESEEPGEVPGSQTQLEMAEDDSAVLFNPGAAYFISYTPDECNDMTIFDMFQNHKFSQNWSLYKRRFDQMQSPKILKRTC